MEYRAHCDCGQFSLYLEGVPRFVNACACRSRLCQGTGPLGIGMFFERSALLEAGGSYKIFERLTDSGHKAQRFFCDQCGSALYWLTESLPDLVGVSWGALESDENRESLSPNWVVWSRSLPQWLTVGEIEHFETQPEVS